MIFIAHRGNLNGADPERENTPAYIQKALDAGFDVEVDIWYKDDLLWLGHDKPLITLPGSFYFHRKIWFHAKDIKTFAFLAEGAANCFFHENDPVVLTTRGYLWVHPAHEEKINEIENKNKIIQVHPKKIIKGVGGYCADNIQEIIDNLK